MMRLKIWPAEDAAVDDVRKTFAVRDLEAAVERARYGDALARQVRVAYSKLEVFNSALWLFSKTLSYYNSQNEL